MPSNQDLDPGTVCTLCGAGFYAEAGQAGDCIACQPGKFGGGAGGTTNATCEPCGPGQYTGFGASMCEFCTAGQADADVDASTLCTSCPSGTYAGCAASEGAVSSPSNMQQWTLLTVNPKTPVL